MSWGWGWESEVGVGVGVQWQMVVVKERMASIKSRVTRLVAWHWAKVSCNNIWCEWKHKKTVVKHDLIHLILETTLSGSSCFYLQCIYLFIFFSLFFIVDSIIFIFTLDPPHTHAHTLISNLTLSGSPLRSPEWFSPLLKVALLARYRYETQAQVSDSKISVFLFYSTRHLQWQFVPGVLRDDTMKKYFFVF